MDDYNAYLIILGLSVIYLRRIVQKSANVEKAWEGIYAIVNPASYLLIAFITFVLTGSIWIALLVTLFIHSFKLDAVFVLIEIFESILEAIANFISEQPRRVKAYFVRKKTYVVLPGSYLLRIGRLFLPAPQLIVLQREIDDMRRERREALNSKQFWRARILVWAYYVGIFYSAVRFMGQKSAEIVGFLPKSKD